MPTQQDSARFFFFIILTFWIFSTPNNAPLISGQNVIKDRLAKQRAAHGILNSTSWGDFAPIIPPPTPPAGEKDDVVESGKFLNLTGFRPEDNFAWDDLERFRKKCDEWSLNAVGVPEAALPVWQNATGVVHGLWHRENGTSPRFQSSYNLTAMTPNVTWAQGESEWNRNITGREGKMLVRIDDDEGAGTEPEVIDHRILRENEVRAREITATITLEDIEGTGSQWDMRLHGVHWPREGAMLVTTTSDKFAGIFGLPHLTSRPHFFESSQALLNRTLDKVLSKKEQAFFLDQMDPWGSSAEGLGDSLMPTAHCEYLMYIQIHPPEKDYLGVKAELTGPENIVKAIHEIEDELRFPKGAVHPTGPKLQMSAVLFSPDCSFFIETKGPPAYAPADGLHLQGMKQETFLYSITVWLIGLGIIVFGQVQLLKLQVRETSTPSTLGRISFYTASIMLLADGTVFIGSVAWSLSASTTLLPSLMVTGASFLSMMTGNMFLGEIYKVQEPEWRREERERQRERQQREEANAARYAAANPTPATTTTPASNQPAAPTADVPFIVPSDQDIGAEIEEVNDRNSNNNATLPAPATAPNTNAAATTTPGSTPLSQIFGRLIMASTLILFLTLATTGWRPALRAAYFNLLAFAYLSLWWPQIYRNAYRNCRRALAWPFVVGQSILRMLPIGYFYLVKDNFAFAEPDWTSFAVLAAWVWIQIVVLVAQAVLGPRFGVPTGWMPEAWEYHPILREDSVEAAGLPIGLVASPSSPIERVKTGEEGAGKKTNVYGTQCVVCRENLDVPVIKAGEDDPTAGGVAGVLARRTYMVTPCRHIFHSDCLEAWMRFRLQCPICRDELPPL